LIKAYNEDKVIVLPVKLGTKIYREFLQCEHSDVKGRCSYFYQKSDGSYSGGGCLNCIDKNEIYKLDEHEFKLEYIDKKHREWDLRYEDFSLDKDKVINHINILNLKEGIGDVVNISESSVRTIDGKK